MFSGEMVAPFGETSQPHLEKPEIRSCLRIAEGRKEERPPDRRLHLRLPRLAFSTRPLPQAPRPLPD